MLSWSQIAHKGQGCQLKSIAARGVDFVVY